MLVKLTKSQFQQHSKRLFILVLPILITQFCQAGLGVVDAIMAGRVSALDLAAVSIGGGIWLPIFLFAMGILIATTPLVGEALGKDAYSDVPHITQQALWTALGIGLVGMLIVMASPLAFNLLGVPDNIQPIARDYLHYVAFGFPAMAGYAVLRSYCEALEHPEAVTVISVIGLLADIPINYVFIYGMSFTSIGLSGFDIPALGGAGCGIATAMVLWINFILLSLYLAYSKFPLVAKTRFYQQFSRPDKQQISKMLALGIPIGVSIFFEASMFSLAALIISPLGELAVASHQVALSVSSQLFMIPMSISLGLTIMIANRYGEGNLDALRQVQTTGLFWSASIATVCTIGIYMFRPQLAMAFSEDPAVVSIAMSLLVYAMAYQVFDAWQVNVAGILRGIQDTQVPMYLTFFSYWVVALPLGTYLVRYTDIGVEGFWIALVTGLCIASLLLSLRLIKQKSTLKKRFNIMD